jgi:hypothetical protein
LRAPRMSAGIARYQISKSESLSQACWMNIAW